MDAINTQPKPDLAAFHPFEIVEGAMDGGLLLLCDHARNTLPKEYGTLGLLETDFGRHIAYDIGAEALTLALADRLGVPAVHSCFSRLLVDPNRGEDDPTIVMRLSDGTVIPGNHPISREEIDRRITNFHAPYHRAIGHTLDEMIATGTVPCVFSIHSFTPFWKLVPRKWEAGILWDKDPRLPRFMIDALRRDAALTIGDNEPYDGALCNDTMHRHCTRRGLPHALLEVRQDLIDDEKGVEEWVDRLVPLLEEAIARPDMHEIEFFGSRTDAPVREGKPS